MSELRVVDKRIRMALAGSQVFRAPVDSVSGRTAVIRTGGELVPAILPTGVDVRAGDSVECIRPRGVTGTIQVLHAVGRTADPVESGGGGGADLPPVGAEDDVLTTVAGAWTAAAPGVTWAAVVAEIAAELAAYQAKVRGFQPFALPLGASASDMVATTQSNLIAVSGGNGGAIAVPFDLHAPMAIQSVTIRQQSSASARSAEFALYAEGTTSAAAMARIAGTTGTFSFTPSAADDRTANVGTPGTIIGPGIVWLVLRNTSASQTFQIRRAAAMTELVGTLAIQENTSGIAALGASVNLTSWASTFPSVVLARLNGRVFGQSAAF